MAAIVLEKLTKKFGDATAVDAIDLEIPDKEMTVLVGPSGCGKTTTLRLIAGLEDVTTGQIRIGDRAVNRVAPKDRDIAMVFQNYALYPHMNVHENMAFGLKMRRVARSEIDRRVREAAIMMGIEDLLNRKPSQLSGGQRQRVAVGRAIVRDPAVFLFDEPLSNLDAKLRVVMRTELVKLQRRLQTTTIHVTHDQVEAMTMGDRIVVMNAGSIQQVGRPMDVYNHPANRFVAEFIGSPPIRFIDGIVTMQNDRATIDCGSLRLSVPESRQETLASFVGQMITIGVRAEYVSDQRPHEHESDWSALDAKVSVVHSLGADTILELEIGQISIVARVDPRHHYDHGQGLEVFINVAKCHFFEKHSGKAI